MRDAFPLTWLGALVGAGSVYALWHFGLSRYDLVFLAMGMVGLGALVVANVTAVVAALLIRRKLRNEVMPDRTPFEGECGIGAYGGFEIHRPWLPFVRVGWSWVTPEVVVRQHKRGRRVVEEVIAKRRGAADRIVRRLEVSDSFGFARVAFRHAQDRRVKFVPSTGAIREVQVVRSMAGGDSVSYPHAPATGERIDMRRYAAGDPIRHVLWKVYARTQQLMVRTQERAIAPVEKTVAYLVTGPSDEASAGAARAAVAAGLLGDDWILGADGGAEDATERHAADDLLAQSANTSAEDGGKGLAAFLLRASHGPVSRAVVFVPASPGPWLDEVRRAVQSFGGQNPGSPIEFVVAVDGIAEGDRRSWLKRLVFEDAPPPVDGFANAPVAAEAIRGVATALSSARGPMLVLDRVTGAAYGDVLTPPAQRPEAA